MQRTKIRNKKIRIKIRKIRNKRIQLTVGILVVKFGQLGVTF